MSELKEYKFRIMGKVKAKQSVKFGRNGVKYTPDDMVNYANWVKLAFKKEYPEHLPHELDGFNLEIKLDVYFKYPAYIEKSSKKLKLAEDNILRPTVKPDWDNISKNICDALNGLAYTDDKAIVDGSVHKYYSKYDYVDVTLIGRHYL